jgi:ATP-binding cassette subfamily F protein 3
VRVREERAEAAKTAKRAKPVVKQAAAPPPDASKPRSKNEQARAKKLEAEIARAEAALVALEVELADPGAWSDPRASEKSTARHAAAKKALEELYARWEAVAG